MARRQSASATSDVSPPAAAAAAAAVRTAELLSPGMTSESVSWRR